MINLLLYVGHPFQRIHQSGKCNLTSLRVREERGKDWRCNCKCWYQVQVTSCFLCPLIANKWHSPGRLDKQLSTLSRDCLSQLEGFSFALSPSSSPIRSSSSTSCNYNGWKGSKQSNHMCIWLNWSQTGHPLSPSVSLVVSPVPLDYWLAWTHNKWIQRKLSCWCDCKCFNSRAK